MHYNNFASSSKRITRERGNALYGENFIAKISLRSNYHVEIKSHARDRFNSIGRGGEGGGRGYGRWIASAEVWPALSYVSSLLIPL